MTSQIMICPDNLSRQCRSIISDSGLVTLHPMELEPFCLTENPMVSKSLSPMPPEPLHWLKGITVSWTRKPWQSFLVFRSFTSTSMVSTSQFYLITSLYSIYLGNIVLFPPSHHLAFKGGQSHYLHMTTPSCTDLVKTMPMPIFQPSSVACCGS